MLNVNDLQASVDLLGLFLIKRSTLVPPTARDGGHW
jgi:hypothetical protein